MTEFDYGDPLPHLADFKELWLKAALRHSEHYLRVLARTNELYLQGHSGVLEGRALFDREADNIRAGQAWAAKHSGTVNTAATLCRGYALAGGHILDLRLSIQER